MCELDLNTARTNKESNVVEKGHHFGSPCNLFSINLFLVLKSFVVSLQI